MSKSNILGDLLRKLREDSHYTLHQMSMIVDIDSTLISKFENGNRVPSVNYLIKYSNAFGVDINKLLSFQKAQIILNKLGIDETTINAFNVLSQIKKEKENND